MLETEKLEIHAKNIESLKDFLKGNTGKILVDLENSMKEKAKNLEFEEAAKIKTQIESIREISVKQIARDTISGDADAFVFLEKYERIFAGIAQIRAGEIVSVRNVEIETRLGEAKDEIISEFLGQEYALNVSKQLLLTDENLGDFQELLVNLHVQVENPSI
jgi:excinuclease ABC subunit C